MADDRASSQPRRSRLAPPPTAGASSVRAQPAGSRVGFGSSASRGSTFAASTAASRASTFSSSAFGRNVTTRAQRPSSAESSTASSRLRQKPTTTAAAASAPKKSVTAASSDLFAALASDEQPSTSAESSLSKQTVTTTVTTATKTTTTTTTFAASIASSAAAATAPAAGQLFSMDDSDLGGDDDDGWGVDSPSNILSPSSGTEEMTGTTSATKTFEEDEFGWVDGVSPQAPLPASAQVLAHVPTAVEPPPSPAKVDAPAATTTAASSGWGDEFEYNADATEALADESAWNDDDEWGTLAPEANGATVPAEVPAVATEEKHAVSEPTIEPPALEPAPTTAIVHEAPSVPSASTVSADLGATLSPSGQAGEFWGDEADEELFGDEEPIEAAPVESSPLPDVGGLSLQTPPFQAQHVEVVASPQVSSVFSYNQFESSEVVTDAASAEAGWGDEDSWLGDSEESQDVGAVSVLAETSEIVETSEVVHVESTTTVEYTTEHEEATQGRVLDGTLVESSVAPHETFGASASTDFQHSYASEASESNPTGATGYFGEHVDYSSHQQFEATDVSNGEQVDYSSHQHLEATDVSNENRGYEGFSHEDVQTLDHSTHPFHEHENADQSTYSYHHHTENPDQSACSYQQPEGVHQSDYSYAEHNELSSHFSEQVNSVEQTTHSFQQLVVDAHQSNYPYEHHVDSVEQSSYSFQQHKESGEFGRQEHHEGEESVTVETSQTHHSEVKESEDRELNELSFDHMHQTDVQEEFTNEPNQRQVTWETHEEDAKTTGGKSSGVEEAQGSNSFVPPLVPVNKGEVSFGSSSFGAAELTYGHYYHDHHRTPSEAEVGSVASFAEASSAGATFGGSDNVSDGTYSDGEYASETRSVFGSSSAHSTAFITEPPSSSDGQGSVEENGTYDQRSDISSTIGAGGGTQSDFDVSSTRSALFENEVTSTGFEQADDVYTYGEHSGHHHFGGNEYDEFTHRVSDSTHGFETEGSSVLADFGSTDAASIASSRLSQVTDRQEVPSPVASRSSTPATYGVSSSEDLPTASDLEFEHSDTENLFASSSSEVESSPVGAPSPFGASVPQTTPFEGSFQTTSDDGLSPFSSQQAASPVPPPSDSFTNAAFHGDTAVEEDANPFSSGTASFGFPASPSGDFTDPPVHTSDEVTSEELPSAASLFGVSSTNDSPFGMYGGSHPASPQPFDETPIADAGGLFADAPAVPGFGGFDQSHAASNFFGGAQASSTHNYNHEASLQHYGFDNQTHQSASEVFGGSGHSQFDSGAYEYNSTSHHAGGFEGNAHQFAGTYDYNQPAAETFGGSPEGTFGAHGGGDFGSYDSTTVAADSFFGGASAASAADVFGSGGADAQQSDWYNGQSHYDQTEPVDDRISSELSAPVETRNLAQIAPSAEVHAERAISNESLENTTIENAPLTHHEQVSQSFDSHTTSVVATSDDTSTGIHEEREVAQTPWASEGLGHESSSFDYSSHQEAHAGSTVSQVNDFFTSDQSPAAVSASHGGEQNFGQSGETSAVDLFASSDVHPSASHGFGHEQNEHMHGQFYTEESFARATSGLMHDSTEATSDLSSSFEVPASSQLEEVGPGSVPAPAAEQTEVPNPDEFSTTLGNDQQKPELGGDNYYGESAEASSAMFGSSTDATYQSDPSAFFGGQDASGSYGGAGELPVAGDFDASFGYNDQKQGESDHHPGESAEVSSSMFDSSVDAMYQADSSTFFGSENTSDPFGAGGGNDVSGFFSNGPAQHHLAGGIYAQPPEADTSYEGFSQSHYGENQVGFGNPPNEYVQTDAHTHHHYNAHGHQESQAPTPSTPNMSYEATSTEASSHFESSHTFSYAASSHAPTTYHADYEGARHDTHHAGHYDASYRTPDRRLGTGPVTPVTASASHNETKPSYNQFAKASDRQPKQSKPAYVNFAATAQATISHETKSTFAAHTSSATLTSNKYKDPNMVVPSCLTSFGFGGNVVTMFPKQKLRLNSASFASRSSPRTPMSMQYDNASQGELRKGPIGIYRMDHVYPKNSEFEELEKFPGPLSDSVTEEAILQFVDEKMSSGGSSQANEDERLLLGVLRVLIKCNGRLRSDANANPNDPGSPEVQLVSLLKESDQRRRRNQASHFPPPKPVQYSTHHDAAARNASRVRELLLLGDRKAAVDVAIQAQMWPEAMLIGSFTDKDEYKRVLCAYFTSHYAPGDPCRALYLSFADQQERSVHEPQKLMHQGTQEDSSAILSTWVVHVQMLLANRTADTNKILVELGDRLWNEAKAVVAAHVCYLLAGNTVEAPSPSSKIALLGADHRTPEEARFYVSPAAVQRTEIYEWVQKRLNPAATNMIPFQGYKLIYAMILADHGKLETAFKYVNAMLTVIRAITATMKPGTSMYLEGMQNQLIVLDDRLRQHLGQDRADSVAAAASAKQGKWGLGSALSIMGKIVNRVVEGNDAPQQSGPPRSSNGSLFQGAPRSNNNAVPPQPEYPSGAAIGFSSATVPAPVHTAPGSGRGGTPYGAQPPSYNNAPPAAAPYQPPNVPAAFNVPRPQPGRNSAPPHQPVSSGGTNAPAPPLSSGGGNAFAAAPPQHSHQIASSQFDLAPPVQAPPPFQKPSLDLSGEAGKSGFGQETSAPPAASKPKSPRSPRAVGGGPGSDKGSKSPKVKDTKKGGRSKTPPPSRSSSGWLSGLSTFIAAKMNPDAKVAKLGDHMDAYFDEEKKRWVFPGETQADEPPMPSAPPTGPLPGSTPASTSGGPPAGPPGTHSAPGSMAGNAPDDPLAALMAPPPVRAHAALMKKDPLSAMMAPPPNRAMYGQRANTMPAKRPPRPQFAVFKPVPGSTASSAPSDQDPSPSNEPPAQ